jgi:ribosomal protein S18 acetylase RimI-like enzyme
VLDNIVWHSIVTVHGPLADRNGRAARFHPAVSPFAAVADLADDDAWNDLRDLIDAAPAMLFAPNVAIPDGWTRDMTVPCLQMVATGVTLPDEPPTFAKLGRDDVADMVALAKATRPGPFDDRTIELGDYFGLREDGRLVAMAGERFRAPGWTEISAVCTVEEVRGRGLARQLVQKVLAGIRKRGEEAVLHVLSDNAPAIALYRSMGFTVRTEAEAVILRWTGGR